MNKCPRCNSPKPHLHPAAQSEGEAEICTHDFHLRSTNQTDERVLRAIDAKRREQAA